MGQGKVLIHQTTLQAGRHSSGLLAASL